MNDRQIKHFYLTEVLGTKVYNHGKKIGKLDDIVIKESDSFPEVTFLYVSRPFGDASLLMPWKNVTAFSSQEIAIDVDDIKDYESSSLENYILLKDHILDKKVIDMQDRDVEVVYDIRLTLKDNKLSVSDADLSKYRMFRRLGLKKFADFLQFIAGKMRDQKVPWHYIQHLPPELDRFKGAIRLKVLKEKLAEMHPADLADIIEELDYNQRAAVFNELDPEHASDTLEEMSPNVQRDITESISKNKIIQLFSYMTPMQIADVLSALPRDQANLLLSSISDDKVKKVRSLLDSQTVQILNLATNRIITCSPTMTVQDAQETYHMLAKGKDVAMYLYITDEENKLLGVLDIKELLAADEKSLLKKNMIRNVSTLTPNSTYKEAYELFEHYAFRAVPIVDNEGKLLGAVTYKDIKELQHHFVT